MIKKKVMKVPQNLIDKFIRLISEEQGVRRAQDQANDYAARMYVEINQAKINLWKEIFATFGLKDDPNFDKPKWTIDLKNSILKPYKQQKRKIIK